MADQLAGNAIDVHSSEIVQLGTMTIEYLVAYYDADWNALAVDYVHDIIPFLQSPSCCSPWLVIAW